LECSFGGWCIMLTRAKGKRKPSSEKQIKQRKLCMMLGSVIAAQTFHNGMLATLIAEGLYNRELMRCYDLFKNELKVTEAIIRRRLQNLSTKD